MTEFKKGDRVATLVGAGDKHRFGFVESMPSEKGTVGTVYSVHERKGEENAAAVFFSDRNMYYMYSCKELQHVSDSKGSLYESVTVHGDEIQTQVSLQNENAALTQQLRELEQEEQALRERLLRLEHKIQRKRDYRATNTRKLKAWGTLLDKQA